AQIGQTWLNYIIEKRTILWWGGLGNSTEHTAFLRLKSGIPAPQSGSIVLNSKVVAEQIGAQIFIDGWAMIAPGDPALAADLAHRAGSVSHDGEAIYGAQVLAAMEAQAFIEHDINKLIDVGVSFIPKDSIIARMIGDVREWHAKDSDWHQTRQRIQDNYGYDRYGGNCHMVPNHALIILSVLYGDDDFQKTLMIVNTAGWDTDCNSGNVGCLMGLKNGLKGIDTGPDFRGPVADRMYMPTADGGRSISDALTETYQVINVGRALAGLPAAAPKNGARYHFSLPGSVQGFVADNSIESKGTLAVENVTLDAADPRRALALHYKDVASGRVARAGVKTFIPLEYAHAVLHYGLLASPSIYPGQELHARLIKPAEGAEAAQVGLYLRHYAADDQLLLVEGPSLLLKPGETSELTWKIPQLDGQPVEEVGVQISSQRRLSGTVLLDFLTWNGTPDVRLTRPEQGAMWRKAWVNAVDSYEERWPEPYRLSQDHGIGMIIQGTCEWQDYTVQATVEPHLVKSTGIAARVQGLERYYALLLCAGQRIRLVKALDGQHTLVEKEYNFEWDQPVQLQIKVQGKRIQAWANQQLVFDIQDRDRPLTSGAVALVIEEGRMSCNEVIVHG
ncbi:MAG: ADP-ribosylglycohydrolase family protein, partial [Chloroflexi bacterium]|nr:ADP-ribosylglycohydrolase family protein [Chloroflexota bacterium]